MRYIYQLMLELSEVIYLFELQLNYLIYQFKNDKIRKYEGIFSHVTKKYVQIVNPMPIYHDFRCPDCQ